MAVAHVRQPADFTLPADPGQLFAALQGLPLEQRGDFTREVLEAMGSVKSEDDFKPVLLVLERWYRTALLQQHPGWQRAVAQADEIAAGGKPKDVHELGFDQLRREVTRRRRSA